MIVWGFDPGVTTGFAIIEDGEVVYSKNFKGDRILRKPSFYEELVELLHQHPADIIVIEKTIGYGKTRMDAGFVRTMEVVGWVTAFAMANQVAFRRQEPSQRRPFLDQANRLSSGSVHQKDAIAHALAFMDKFELKGVN